jgi:hypothetical protein
VSSQVPAPVSDAVQTDLIGSSPRWGYDEFRRLCSHAVEVVDPDAADLLLERQLLADEQRALQSARLSFRRVGDGTTRLSGLLPDAQADLFKAALDAYAAPRRQHPSQQLQIADGSDEAAPGLGPSLAELIAPADPVLAQQPTRLPYPTRLGRALCDLLEHLPVDKLPQHGAGSASIVVTMSLEQLAGAAGETLLDTGTAMSAGQARRLACNAQLIPAVLDGDSRLLDLGTGRRLFDRHQRLALALRDHGCIFPGCDRPAAWTEAHHITPWSRGGPTDLANGCLLCCYHHHLIHQGEWQVVMAPDGVPEILPPPRLDPDQTPRRHERFRQRRC